MMLWLVFFVDILVSCSHLGESAFLFRLFLLACCDPHQVIRAASLVLVLVFKLLFHLFDLWLNLLLLDSRQVHLLHVVLHFKAVFGRV